jgi:ABC-2 type transport system ATP-binding protein
MATQNYAIEVKGLTKRYGQILAVDHISFEVKKGELFGFLGPNGAGKTTAIRMLIGVIKKDEGEASVMGHAAGSLPAKQLSGVVPEMVNAYMDLSGWSNLMLMAELYRTPAAEARKRAEALLQELGLYERKDSKAVTYSMGMRKRLILAMALLSDPQILFLDEPTSGLDVQSARSIRAMLRNLRKEGKTIMLTTHNMDEAAELSDRLAIINHGKLVAVDTPNNLSITGGRVYLIDVNFDKPVRSEVLAKLPGVSRLETAQAIEAAESMRAAAAMGGAARTRMMQADGGAGGGMAPSPERMRMMQNMMAEGGGAPDPERMKMMQKMMQEGGAPSPDQMRMMQDRMKARAAGKGAPAEDTNAVKPSGAEAQDKLPDAGEGGKPDSSRFRLYTEDTTLLVTALVDFSRANSLTMNILNVRSPSLEDAFVRLTEEKSREK